MLLMGKSTISMAIFNSYVCLPEGSPTVEKNIGQIVQKNEHHRSPKQFLLKKQLPSGKHTKSYWKWPFIVSFPMKNGDFP